MCLPRLVIQTFLGKSHGGCVWQHHQGRLPHLSMIDQLRLVAYESEAEVASRHTTSCVDWEDYASIARSLY